jgi:hypothetical protein
MGGINKRTVVQADSSKKKKKKPERSYLKNNENVIKNNNGAWLPLHLPHKCEALNSNPSSGKTNRTSEPHVLKFCHL